MHANNLTNERLAAHQCVMCGQYLSGDAPSDLFCGPDHQRSWHLTERLAAGRQDEIDIALSRSTANVTDLPIMPRGTEPADLRSEPWFVPAAAGDHPDPSVIDNYLPEWVVGAERRQGRSDLTTHQVALRLRPGMRAQRMPGCRSAGADQLGESLIEGRGPLRVMAPEPIYSTEPIRYVHWMEREAEPPWRLTHPGRWWNPPGFTCRYMAREVGGRRQLAVVTYLGSVSRWAPWDWGDDDRPLWLVLRRRAWHMCGHRCHACDNIAERWYLLAGTLVLDHYMWAATDGEPLRLGLCDEHALNVEALL